MCHYYNLIFVKNHTRNLVLNFQLFEIICYHTQIEIFYGHFKSILHIVVCL